MTNRAQQTMSNILTLGEDFTNPADSIKPIIQKLSDIKFPTDAARQDWVARIKERFGEDVANLADQYAGKPASSVPDQMTPAMKTLMDNINGVIRGNPGF